MDTLAVIIMIILFIILMAFVFSSALLTPLIGKKNLLFVIALGFVVGIIGGAFFLAPVFNDIPGMTRSVYQITSNSPEMIVANISTDVDVNQAIANIKKIQGVKSVETENIILNTTPINEFWKGSIEKRATTSNPNITSVEVVSNDTILVHTKPDANPPDTIINFKKWVMLVSGITVKYSIVQIKISAEASQVDSLIEKLPREQAVVNEISGPTEENVQYIEKILPNTLSLILFCGFLGVLTGLAGVFIDTIIQTLKNLLERVKKNK